jgi:hypothetical protein
MAVHDLIAAPEQLGNAARPELGDGIRSYHSLHDKEALQRHATPTFLYRVGDGRIVEIGHSLGGALTTATHDGAYRCC